MPIIAYDININYITQIKTYFINKSFYLIKYLYLMASLMQLNQKGIINQKNYIYHEIMDIKGPRELTQEEFEVLEDINDIHEIKELSNSANDYNTYQSYCYKSQTYQPFRTTKNIYGKVEIKLEGDPSTITSFATYKPNRDYSASSQSCQRWSAVDGNKTKKNLYKNKITLCPECEEDEKYKGLCDECKKEEKSKRKKEVLCDECKREQERLKNKCLNKQEVLCNECKQEEIKNNKENEKLLYEYKLEEENIRINDDDDGEQIKIGVVDAPFLSEENEGNKTLNDSDRKDLINSILKELDKEENIDENTSLKITFKVLNENKH